MKVGPAGRLFDLVQLAQQQRWSVEALPPDETKRVERKLPRVVSARANEAAKFAGELKS